MITNIKPFDVAKKNPTHVVIEIFGGDNNLGGDKDRFGNYINYLDNDMNEMLTGIPEYMSVLCLADYYKDEHGNNKPAEVVELTKEGRKKIIEHWGEINTGDPAILAEFLSRALVTYSKDTMIAIGFWDHGSGTFDETDPQKKRAIGAALKSSRENRIKLLKPVRNLFIGNLKANKNLAVQEKAMLHDVTNGGLLTNREAERMLHSAFEQSGDLDRKVSMIFSDTCLNGMVEVMHELAQYAEVIVGSEDLEPGDGWDYKRWFEKMAAEPPTTSAQWAKQAVEAFGEAYNDNTDFHPCTLAAFKTDNTIVQMFKELIDTVDADGEKGFKWMVLARTFTQSFDVYASYDLLHFTQNLKEQAESDTVKKKADDIAAVLQGCRVHSVAIGESVPDAQGLSFWFPQDKSVYRKDAETYRTLSFDAETGWTKYLKKYYRL